MVQTALVRAPSRTQAFTRSNRCRDNGHSRRGVEVRSEALLDGKQVAVVGAGPAGMIAAAHMAKLGANVDIYDRYVESSTVTDTSKPKGEGWLILIDAFVAKAFQEAGISPELPSYSKWPGSGLMFPKATQFVGPWAGMPTTGYLASRLTMTEHITQECNRVYGSKVTVHPGFALTGGNPAQGHLTFEGPGEKAVEVKADLVIGADGVESGVRKLMQEHDSDLKVVATSLCVTKSLAVFLSSQGSPLEWGQLPDASGEPSGPFVPEGVDSVVGATSHTFFSDPEGARDMVAFGLFASDSGKDMSVALTTSPEWWEIPKTEEKVLEDIKAGFPTVPLVWLEETAAECARVINAGDIDQLKQDSFLELNKLGSGRAVLIGNASHATSFHLGMGCISAIEDGAALAGAVRAANGNLAATAAEFTARRLPEMAALVRITRDMCTQVTYPVHRSIGQMLGALPFVIGFAAAAKKGKLPGWLLPKLSTFSLRAGVLAQDVEASLCGYGRTVIFCVAAVAVAVFGALFKAAALVAA